MNGTGRYGPRITLLLPVALTGFAAITSQIVYARELLSVFYGNELSTAFILAGWLIGGAAGSALFGKVSDKISSAIGAFALCQLILSPVLPLTVIAIKSIPIIIGMNPGEIMPFYSMAVSSLFVLAPSCAMLGFLFALGCRIYRDVAATAAEGVGNVYIIEAIGAVTGGLLTSFLLVRTLSSIHIMAALGASLAFISMFMAASVEGAGRKRRLFAASLFFIVFEILFIFSGVWRRLDAQLSAKYWHGYDILDSRSSIYGNVTIVKNASQYSLFSNGLHLYSVPDRQSSEEAVHLAMLEHRDPKNVLLIGGGVGGLVGEVLKHPVERVDYVEIDPLIIKMAKEYLPADYYAPLEDEKVYTHFTDGRTYVKDSKIEYDIVIVALGDPYTAQLNRFYTVEFFREAKNIMSVGGVLSFGLGASESYMSRESREFLGSIRMTLGAVFPEVLVMPGETAYFMASDGSTDLTYDYSVMMARASERGARLKYVREYYLASRLSPDSVAFMHRSISDTAKKFLNRDFRPISYYFDMVSWSARFRDSLFTRILKRADKGAIISLLGLIVMAMVVSGVRYAFMQDGLRRACIMAVGANGFGQLILQLALILSFQIIYGYVYYKLGFIMTAFMAGLASGGYLSLRAIRRFKDPGRILIAVQVLLCLYPVALLPILHVLSASGSGHASWVGSNLVFIFLPFISGLMGGSVFPVAARIFIDSRGSAGSSGGLLYGTDLIGSCAGALLAGTFMVPILGIPAACLCVAAVGAAALIALVLCKDRYIPGGTL